MPQNNGYTIYHSDGSAKDVAPEHTPIIDKLAADNSDESINNFYDPNHIPSNTVKITKNNVTKDVDVRSKEYKELYNSGHLTSYDDKTNTYYATPLKEVTITAEAPQWLKNKRQFEKEYTKDKFIDETMPKFSRSMGISSTNMNPNNVKEYDSRINDKVVENIFKRNPTFDTDYSNDRLEALQGFSQKELELIKNSKYASKIEPSIWSKFEQGLLSVGNAGSPVTFKNPSLSQEEAKKENNPLNILQPLSVPSKMVQSAYKDNYSFKDALSGKQNNASVGEDLITDPLNLVGLGVWGKLNKADKLVDLYRIEEQGAKTFAQLSVENKIPKVFNTPEVLARKANEEKHFGQWFTNNIDDINWYAKDREFTNPQIYHVQVPESKLKSFKEFDESLSRAKDREFILPNSVKNSGKIYNGLDEFNQSVKGLSKEEQLSKLNTFVKETPKSVEYNPSNNLTLKSIEDGSPLEKSLSKNGEININTLQAHINNNATSKADKHILQKVVDNHFPNKTSINYNELKNKVSDELVELNKTDLPQGNMENYGLDRIGFPNNTSASFTGKVPQHYQDIYNNINNSNTFYKGHDNKYWFDKLSMDKGFNTKEEGIKWLESQMAHNKQMNKTITFSNEEKFGRGSSDHFNENTLGHSRVFVSPEEPNVFHVLESQSDFYQKNKLKPLDIEKHQKSLQRMEELQNRNKSVLEKMQKEGVDEAGIPVQDYQIKQFEDLVKGQESNNNMKRGDIANFNQKILLGDKHQERLLQENLDYAAKNGQSKLRYPTSETAAKIQGYKKLQTEVPIVGENELAPPPELVDMNTNTSYFNGNDYLPEHKTILKKYSEYPKMVKKTLGLDVKEVKDVKGNTWYELDIPKSFKDRKGKIKALSMLPLGIGLQQYLQNQNKETK